jgi:hypothetical protein
MLDRRTRAPALGLAIATTVLAHPAPSRACGGCFHPPPRQDETVTAVTDHRMILSVSRTQTTLYDEIRYAGAPSSFAWVLPVYGSPTVDISSDALFQVLDTMTAVQIVAPTPDCPVCPVSGPPPLRPVSAATNDGSGVVVERTAIVGPYETAVLSATDPDALRSWLAQHGYVIPDAIAPILDAYVATHASFVALKLVPGANDRGMKPVRVTVPGPATTLPLRMIAAGAGATVGVTLFVVAEGRYEPTSAPTFFVPEEDITWDFATDSSDYRALRDARAAALSGRAWEVESSGDVAQPYAATFLANVAVPGVDYDTALARDADLATLFAGVPPESTRVTRLRADLPNAALSADLVLGASADQGRLSNVRFVSHAANVPACPACPPSSAAPASTDGQAAHGNGACSLTPPTESDGTTAGLVVLGALALGTTRVRRRRPR